MICRINIEDMQRMDSYMHYKLELRKLNLIRQDILNISKKMKTILFQLLMILHLI